LQRPPVNQEAPSASPLAGRDAAAIGLDIREETRGAAADAVWYDFTTGGASQHFFFPEAPASLPSLASAPLCHRVGPCRRRRISPLIGVAVCRRAAPHRDGRFERSVIPSAFGGRPPPG
jgi:hypothetical protein